jgi:hypothetical protein
LEFELRAFTLSHSTALFCVGFFCTRVSQNYLPRLASNLDPPDLCLLSNWDYRREPPVPAKIVHSSGRLGYSLFQWTRLAFCVT